MERIVFEVHGSAPEPYKVVFEKHSERNLSASCSCPAGEKGQYCKHRFNILSGVIDGIVNGDESDVEKVQSWLPGTDVEAAMLKVAELEAEADAIKKALSAAKKAVAKAMRG